MSLLLQGNELPVLRLLLSVLVLSLPPSAAGKPNMVIFLADDMGFSDIGCFGSEIQTPVLDALAENGLRFTQFYNTGRCCPTRASLLTGLYPHQAGIGHMVSDRGEKGYLGRLNDRSVTIAEVLRAAGYRTGCFGKWHVTYFDYQTSAAKHRGTWPLQRGFDRFVGSLAGGGNYYGPKGWMVDNEFVEPKEDFYYTDEVSEAAVQFIKEAPKEKPLFLYVAYTAPHWPLHAHEEDIANYKDVYQVGWDAIRESRYQRMLEMGLIKKDWQLSPRDRRAREWKEGASGNAWRAHQMATYAAMIDCMDQGIGNIRKALMETGRDDNTLIFFLSDNGGCEEDVRLPGINRFATEGQDTSNWGNKRNVKAGPPDTFQSYGVPWANASNTPFRWFKSEVHEGGIATPLVVHWPKGIDTKLQGSLVRQTGHVMDLMATCVEVAGAKYPGVYDKRWVQPTEGVSLAPHFKSGAKVTSRVLFFEHEGNRAVREGDWKLVKLRRGPWELYDLAADRTEALNLATEQAQRVRRMTTLWEGWAKRTHVLPGPFGK